MPSRVSPSAMARSPMADYADVQQGIMVGNLVITTSVKVAYANPLPTFDGHGACDADEWINAIVGHDRVRHRRAEHAENHRAQGLIEVTSGLWRTLGHRLLLRHASQPGVVPSLAGADG